MKKLNNTEAELKKCTDFKKSVYSKAISYLRLATLSIIIKEGKLKC